MPFKREIHIVSYLLLQEPSSIINILEKNSKHLQSVGGVFSPADGDREKSLDSSSLAA